MTCRLNKTKDEESVQASPAKPSKNTTPKNPNIKPVDLTFDKNPKLNFIFAARATNTPRNGPVPVISIDLEKTHAQQNHKIQDDFYEKNEDDDEDVKNLMDLKEQLNARALEAHKIKENNENQLENDKNKSEKSQPLDYSKYFTNKQKEQQLLTQAQNIVAGLSQVTPEPNNSPIIERVLKRLCESKDYLCLFKSISKEMADLNTQEAAEMPIKAVQHQKCIAKLQEIANKVPLDAIETEIAYLKNLIIKNKAESIATICTTFDTPTQQIEKPATPNPLQTKPQLPKNSTKYYAQISKLKTENAFLQTQMGKLENTFAELTDKFPEKRPEYLYKTTCNNMSSSLSPVKQEKSRSILLALSKFSKRRLEDQRSIEIMLEKTKQKLEENEKQYNILWEKFNANSRDFEESQQELCYKSRKIIELSNLLENKKLEIQKIQEDLLKSHEFINQLMASKENQKISAQLSGSKENTIKPSGIRFDFNKISMLIKDAISPIILLSKQIFSEVNMYQKVLAFSIARNESAYNIFSILNNDVFLI